MKNPYTPKLDQGAREDYPRAPRDCTMKSMKARSRRTAVQTNRRIGRGSFISFMSFMLFMVIQNILRG